MKPILILETSTVVCSIAVVNELDILALEEIDIPNAHSGQLATMIENTLRQQGLKTKDLGAVAVSSGPGSYTGLRVGSATAKGICFASDIPLIGLDTLKGLSYAPLEPIPNANNYIFSVIDARRNEVYAAVFDPNHHLLLPAKPHIWETTSFERFRQNNAIWHFTGDGAQKSLELSKFSGARILNEKSSAKFFHKMAIEALRSEDFENLTYFTPNYFKAPNITVSNKPLI